jgi:hypothetical protein
MPPRFLLFLVKTNVINGNNGVRKIIVRLRSIACSKKWDCSYTRLKACRSSELKGTQVLNSIALSPCLLCVIFYCVRQTCVSSQHINKSRHSIPLVDYLLFFYSVKRGPRWRSWLRHCPINRKVAGSIPDGVIGIFHWHNPGVDSASNRNEYQEYFLESKGGRCVWLTTLPPSSADCLEIWEPQPPGTLRACPGL